MNYTAVIEYCKNTGLYVGYVPSLSGAHSQGETLEELNANLREVISMLLEDGRPPWKQNLLELSRYLFCELWGIYSPLKLGK